MQALKTKLLSTDENMSLTELGLPPGKTMMQQRMRFYLKQALTEHEFFGIWLGDYSRFTKAERAAYFMGYIGVHLSVVCGLEIVAVERLAMCDCQFGSDIKYSCQLDSNRGSCCMAYYQNMTGDLDLEIQNQGDCGVNVGQVVIVSSLCAQLFSIGKVALVKNLLARETTFTTGLAYSLIVIQIMMALYLHSTLATKADQLGYPAAKMSWAAFTLSTAFSVLFTSVFINIALSLVMWKTGLQKDNFLDETDDYLDISEEPQSQIQTQVQAHAHPSESSANTPL
jgi:hypothetical protein